MVKTEDVDESAYGKPASDYIERMEQPESEGRANVNDVAAIVYEAVTDGKKKWRYTVACDEFIAFRRSMTDEEWIAYIDKMYSNPASV